MGSVSKPHLVFGAAGFNTGSAFPTAEHAREVLDAVEKAGIKQLDTAQLYGLSEQILGEIKASERFIIDTKHVGGFAPGESTREKVVARGLESLKKLGVDKVNIFYIHAPDNSVPLEETLAGIDDLYRQGKFEKFGLSNFNADEVRAVLKITKEKGFVPPTVYQGNYNAVARKLESDLFPLFRENGISFYAYSAIAGGFLTKSKEQLLQESGGEGRWSKSSPIGQMYHKLYNRPKLLEALDIWEKTAAEAGIPKAEMAYRWAAYHSALKEQFGDAIVLGASKISQLEQTVAGLQNGPLPEEVVKKIDDIWELVKDEAPRDNFEIQRK
ncbi:Aldo/keto reductase [Trichoderma citrinoviride]|uniref:Aldo/keto reductase n=1 Tax=Trichoderma citrinoviride TaxID=58853 RepID=A0A2T4B2Y5_9HYPO|nr:Aldo/keto reductase [Trichoderma citrinoviride]PTB63674.1 Aldo/keto reductase [Trichoderma citrinoviride]